jgi:hypothetical protein
MFLKLNITDDWFVWQYSFNSMGCVELNGGIIVADELEGMQEEPVMTYFKVLLQHSLGGSEKNCRYLSQNTETPG